MKADTDGPRGRPPVMTITRSPLFTDGFGWSEVLWARRELADLLESIASSWHEGFLCFCPGVLWDNGHRPRMVGWRRLHLCIENGHFWASRVDFWCAERFRHQKQPLGTRKRAQGPLFRPRTTSINSDHGGRPRPTSGRPRFLLAARTEKRTIRASHSILGGATARSRNGDPSSTNNQQKAPRNRWDLGVNAPTSTTSEMSKSATHTAKSQLNRPPQPPILVLSAPSSSGDAHSRNNWGKAPRNGRERPSRRSGYGWWRDHPASAYHDRIRWKLPPHAPNS